MDTRMLCLGYKDSFPSGDVLSPEAFSSLATQYREDFNARMRQKMLMALTGVSLLLTTLTIGIFHLRWFESLFLFMEKHSEIEDPIVFLIGCVFACIVAVLMVYIHESHNLQADITQLIKEKEKLAESFNRRQHLESLGTIASGISHEINTALQSILGGCELARSRIEDPDACLKAIDRAISSSLHARRITDNVLTFAASGGRTKAEETSLATLVQEAAIFCQTFLPPTIEVRTELPAQDVVITVNRTGFIQAINNLVNNGAHASDYQGEIILTCTLENVPPEKATAVGVKPGIYTRVTVTDYGTGIAPESLSKMFDPFYTTKKEGEGTGLGLSIVHGLIRGMNGFIDVTSEVGKGTQVHVYIPHILA